MRFDSTIMRGSEGIAAVRIEGKTDDGQPFVAFLLRTPISGMSLKFEYAQGGKTVSQYVLDTKALAGMNGGFYVLETGLPLDWLIIDGGTVTELSTGVRPCIALASGRPAIAFPSELGKPTDVMQAGPLLLRDGKIADDYSDYKTNASQFYADITAERYPRTIFGLSDTECFLLAVDGRSEVSAGLYLNECAQLLRDLGARDAINLDGGGSSALVVRGKLLNNPRSSPGQPEPAERAVPTALLVFPR